MAAPMKVFFRSLTYSKNCSLRLLMKNSLYHKPCISRRTCSSHKYEEPLEEDPKYDDSQSSQYDVLYPGHISTTMLQKVLLSVGSAAMSLYNPARDDMIATLGETTGYYALVKMREKMLRDPMGRQILEEQPVINTETVSVDYLGSLPDETFGKNYWRFLSKHGFSPDARLPVHFVDDVDLKYVMLRYRQVHDLYHTVLGMPPNMLGEVVVKWVEAIQTGLPMCALGAVFGPLRLGPKHRQKYLEQYWSWALRNGWNAKFLMAVYFEKLWEKDLTELRHELNIEPPPVIVKEKNNEKVP